MDLNESTKIKVIEINTHFFEREKHALNDLLKRYFNAVDHYEPGQSSSFLCVAEKDEETFNFIVVKDEDVAGDIIDMLMPRQAKKANVHKARFLNLVSDWHPNDLKNEIPSVIKTQDLSNKKLIKIRIFDEPFYLFSTYDPSKVVF